MISKADKPAGKTMHPSKKGGVSSDWAPELTGGKEMYKHTNVPAYHDAYNRDNLLKTQMKQKNCSVDLLPIDIVNKHNRSVTKMEQPNKSQQKIKTE